MKLPPYLPSFLKSQMFAVQKQNLRSANERPVIFFLSLRNIAVIILTSSSPAHSVGRRSDVGPPYGSRIAFTFTAATLRIQVEGQIDSQISCLS